MAEIKLQEARNFLANKRGSGYMRPFIGKDGGAYVLLHKGGDPKDVKNYKRVPVNNATLRYDEWRMLDDAVLKVAEQRLVGFDDLRSNGLVTPLGNAMATTVLTWEEASDALEAFVSIDPVRRGNNDNPDYKAGHIPIPVVHADYTISDRLLQESRNRGNGLDSSNAERAARKVAEQLEDMLFGASATMVYGGGTIHSYISHPDKNTVTLSLAWDDGSKTPAQILADVIAMKQASIDAKFYGPWVLYIPTAYETVMDQDYDTSGASTQTIRQRIEAIAGIQKVQVVDRLPANNVLLVTMQRDVVDLIDGLPMQNVEWNTEGGFVHNYKVLTIQVPRIRSDYNSNSGIVLLA